MALVSAKAPKLDRSLTVEYSFGETLEEAVEIFGAETVFAFFSAKAEIAIQDIIRRLMTAGKTDAEITEFVSSYKLGVPAKRASGGTRKTAVERFLEDLTSGKITTEQILALKAKMEAAVAAKK